MPKQKRAALYLRVSTDGQTTDNRRRELEAIAAQRGWDVVQVYEDRWDQWRKGTGQASWLRCDAEGCHPRSV